MNAQRQLSEKGRSTARDIGAALEKLGLPIGIVYTSRLNRADRKLCRLIRREGSVAEGRTGRDSSYGSASGMANPDGGEFQGRPLRFAKLIDTPPEAGFNNLAITHKTNVTDAFGKEFADIKEGEAAWASIRLAHRVRFRLWVW